VAFDLNAFLQDNRKFLAGSLLGVGVFFAGYALIDSYAGADLRAARNEVGVLRGKMGNASLYSTKNLAAAQEQQKQVEASVKALAKKLNFDRRPQFLLKDDGPSPANQYIGIAAAMRERRLDDARARGIDLVDNVGIPDRSPTEAEDIRRTLRTLDLIDRVLELAIAPGTRSIDKISIVSDRGGERSGKAIQEEIRVELDMVMTSARLSAIKEAAEVSDPPLTIEQIDETSLGSGSGGRGDSLVRVLLTVAALDVAVP
jgi:hypothetical protein